MKFRIFVDSWGLTSVYVDFEGKTSFSHSDILAASVSSFESDSGDEEEEEEKEAAELECIVGENWHEMY